MKAVLLPLTRDLGLYRRLTSVPRLVVAFDPRPTFGSTNEMVSSHAKQGDSVIVLDMAFSIMYTAVYQCSRNESREPQSLSTVRSPWW